MNPTDRPAARLLAFHGGKPGEGKSLLAQNLAAALAENGRRRVLLADLDPQARGEHAVRWDLPQGPVLADLVGHLASFDAQTILGYFPASRSGVAVAALARTEAEARGVASQQILKAMALLRSAYDAVILDGLTGWDSLTLSLLDVAERIFLVCSPDLAGLKQERMDVLRYQELKFPSVKISLIVNRSDLSGALSPSDIEKSLGHHRVVASLPWDGHAVESLNQHRELVSLYPHGVWSKALRDLARRVWDQPAPGSASALDPANLDMGAQAQANPALAVDRSRVKQRIHGLLLENPELRDLASETSRTEAGRLRLREKVESVVTSMMAAEAPELTDRELRERLVQEVVDEALGLGPLEDLIREEAVTEIMVNSREQIYVERSGKLTRVDQAFLSDKQLLTVIERIVAPLGRRIDESQPYVDARLADGSRVNAVIPPLALKGPTLTIRKFSRRRLTVDDLIQFGSLTTEVAAFLGACVQARKNIVIAGGTGSGKTTLLNIVAAFIPEDERIVTVEDAAELNLPQPHVVTLEARPANIEGKGAVTIRDLVRNCLRMRPDRIVVGECRGGEALDMLQAMNTGHDGSLTTAHANTPKDTIARLETMVLMSGMDLPIRAIREQIAGAVHLVVQQSRLQDGSRKVTQVAEVAGLEDGAIVLKDIFIFKQSGLDKTGRVAGTTRPTGYVPAFVAEFAARGIDLSEKIFKK